MNILCKEAAAATAIGTDLMQGNIDQVSPMYRILQRIGVTGSTAIGNAEVQVFFGRTLIGAFRNSTLGAVYPVDYKDMMPVRSTLACEPGEPLRVVVSVASTTNPLVILMETQDIRR